MLDEALEGNETTSIEDFEKLIIDWARDKEILTKATPLTQIAKTIEEVEETRDALFAQQNQLIMYVDSKGRQKETNEEILDGFGDQLVTIIIGLEMQGLEMSQALGQAYNVISKRTGKMVNGMFVKD